MPLYPDTKQDILEKPVYKHFFYVAEVVGASPGVSVGHLPEQMTDVREADVRQLVRLLNISTNIRQTFDTLKRLHETRLARPQLTALITMCESVRLTKQAKVDSGKVTLRVSGFTTMVYFREEADFTDFCKMCPLLITRTRVAASGHQELAARDVRYVVRRKLFHDRYRFKLGFPQKFSSVDGVQLLIQMQQFIMYLDENEVDYHTTVAVNDLHYIAASPATAYWYRPRVVEFNDAVFLPIAKMLCPKMPIIQCVLPGDIDQELHDGF